MPRASSICLTAKCLRVAIHRSRCEIHDPGPWAGSIRNAQRPSNWPTLRRQVRVRDRQTCRLCGALRALEVDHIIPVARGGSWELENLQVLCKTCHDIKTKRESKGGRDGR